MPLTISPTPIMSRSQPRLRLGLQVLALGGVAWASLQLALLVAQVRFFTQLGAPPAGGLARGVVLGLVVGAGVWLHARSDCVAAGMWRAAARRSPT